MLPSGADSASQLCYRRGHHTGSGLGEATEGVERAGNVRGERGRIEGEEPRLERAPRRGGEDTAEEQALIRGLRAVIALREPGAVALLAQDFAQRTEKVEVRLNAAIELLQHGVSAV